MREEIAAPHRGLPWRSADDRIGHGTTNVRCEPIAGSGRAGSFATPVEDRHSGRADVDGVESWSRSCRTPVQLAMVARRTRSRSVIRYAGRRLAGTAGSHCPTASSTPPTVARRTPAAPCCASAHQPVRRAARRNSPRSRLSPSVRSATRQDRLRCVSPGAAGEVPGPVSEEGLRLAVQSRRHTWVDVFTPREGALHGWLAHILQQRALSTHSAGR